MFFGLTNSLATFQTMMNDIFRKEIAKGWVVIYMDDIVYIQRIFMNIENMCHGYYISYEKTSCH